MQFGIDIHGILQHQCLAGLVVAFRLDALDFAEQFAEEGAEFAEVVDHEVGLAVAHFLFNHILCLAVFVAPVGNQLSVLHVRLGVLLAQFDAGELGEDTVADITAVFSFVGLLVGEDAQLHEFLVCQVIKGKEIGTRLLQGGGELLQRTGRGARKQLAGAVAQAFVQVGVEVAGQRAVFAAEGDLLVIPGELGEDALGRLGRRLCIGVGDVGDGHGLGAVLLADPVGVRQVDADGRSGIVVAGNNGHVDHLGAHPFDLGLPEARVDGGVVFEPLGVLADHLRAVRSLLVAEVDDAFVGGLAAERVAVILHETVHEVHVGPGVAHPRNIIGIPHPEVTGAEILDQLTDVFLLDVVLRHGLRLLQMGDNHLYGGPVEAVGLVDLLEDTALLLDQLAVEAVGDGVRVFLVGHPVVEAVHLAGRQVAVIVAAAGGGDDVLLRALVFVGGEEFRIADDRQQFGRLFRGYARCGKERGDIVAAALGQDLVLAVVVMDAVAEEDALGVNQEGVPLLAAALAPVVVEDGLQRVADAEVVLEVLLPDDVAAGLGSLAEVVDVLLLLEGEIIPPRNPVA